MYFLLVRALRSVVRDYVLASTFVLSPLDAMDMRLVASYLEAIGDASVQLAGKARPLREPIPSRIARELVELAEKLAAAQKAAVSAFLAKSPSSAAKAAERVGDIRAALAALSRGPAMAALLHPEVELLKICELVKDITDLVV